MESIDDILERARKKIKVQEQNSGERHVLGADIGDPNCPICHGIGFIARDVPYGEPGFGKMDVCSCRQSKIEKDENERLSRDSNLDSYSDMTFENFNVRGRGQIRQEYELCLKMARDHAQKFAKERKGWLLLTGNFGTGKTHLAAAIAKVALADHVANIFMPVPDLMDWLRASFNSQSESYEDRFQKICTVPLLILDDLGSQSSTDWVQEKLYQIFNYRYVNRLPTVITTNSTLNELDGRIASRLEDPSLVMKVVISAPDYRNPASNSLDSNTLSTLHLYTSRTFDTFDSRIRENLTEEASEQLSQAYHAAFSFAQHPSGWLVFAGTNGVGKTHLAAAIGNYRRQLMEEPLFVVVPDLLDHLRATFSPISSTTFDKEFEKVKNAQLLILDHLDTACATPWAKEKLYQIVNYRYQAELPTVFTTVLTIQEIDPNIRSRLIDFQICQIVQMFQVPMYSKNPAIDILPKRTKRSEGTGFRRIKP